MANSGQRMGTANLPLHYGKVSPWLFGQMCQLAREITVVTVYETPVSLRDTASYGFAHGGKDGYPLPCGQEDLRQQHPVPNSGTGESQNWRQGQARSLQATESVGEVRLLRPDKSGLAMTGGSREKKFGSEQQKGKDCNGIPFFVFARR